MSQNVSITQNLRYYTFRKIWVLFEYMQNTNWLFTESRIELYPTESTKFANFIRRLEPLQLEVNEVQLRYIQNRLSSVIKHVLEVATLNGRNLLNLLNKIKERYRNKEDRLQFSCPLHSQDIWVNIPFFIVIISYVLSHCNMSPNSIGHIYTYIHMYTHLHIWMGAR